MSWEYSSGQAYHDYHPEPPPPTEQPFLDIKRLLQLRTPLMIAVFLAIAIPGAIVAWRITSGKYTATASVRFLAATPRVMQDASGRREITPYNTFLRTQINVITGNTIMRQVLERPEIRNLPVLAQVPAPLEVLKRVVLAEPQVSSELVTISCSMPDRESALTILEEVIAVYMEYALSEEANTGGERLNVLTKERDARQTELDLQLKRIAELQSDLKVPTANGAIMQSDEADLYRQTLVQAELRKAEAQKQISQNTQNIDQLKARLEESLDAAVFLFDIEERVNTNASVQALRENVATAEANFAMLSSQLASEAPKRKIEERNLSSLRSALKRTERQVREESLRGVMAGFEQQLSAAQAEYNDASQQVDRYQKLLEDYDVATQQATRQLAEIEKLKTQAEETQRLLQNVRREITEISLESNAPARVRLESPPYVPPGGPSYSKRKKLLLLVLIAACGAGLGTGILRERTDRRVRSPLDVSSITQVPILAAIPNITEDRMVDRKNIYSLTVDSPESTSADEFRRVLARILYAPPEFGRMATVLVTSPIQGDGKTVVACNLANALAEANRRVLLLDLSIQPPDAQKRFNMAPAPGLSDMFGENGEGDPFVRSGSRENVWLLGPGLRPDELLGKIGSGEMVSFLEKAEQRFDHVIIDTPPLLLFSDAQLLAPLVNGVVVVTGVGISNMGMVKRCLSELKQVRANVLGVVVNGMRRTPGGYLQRNLRLHYDAYAKGDKALRGRKLLEADPHKAEEPPPDESSSA